MTAFVTTGLDYQIARKFIRMRIYGQLPLLYKGSGQSVHTYNWVDYAQKSKRSQRERYNFEAL